MGDVETSEVGYVDDHYLFSRGPWNELDPYPFPPSGVCSETPSEFGLFKVDEGICRCFQETSTVEDFLQAQRDIGLEQDEGTEAYIYSQFLLYLRLCDPISLEDAIARIQKWIENISVDNEDRNRRLQIHQKLKQRHERLEKSAGISRISSQHPFRDGNPNKAHFLTKAHQLKELALYSRPPHPDIYRNPHWYMSAAMEQFERSSKITIYTVRLVEGFLKQIEKDSELLAWFDVLEKLSKDLKAHYEWEGSEEVFSTAVWLGHMLIENMPDYPLKQARLMTDLVEIYQLRSLRIGSLEDLDVAIKMAEALLTLKDLPDSLLFRSSLGTLYGRRFLRNQKRDRYYIDQGIKETRAAVDEVQNIANEMSRPRFEHTLYRNHAWLLFFSFLEDRSPVALDDSVSYYQKAIQTIQRNYGRQYSRHGVDISGQAPYYMELGATLAMRFISRTPSINDASGYEGSERETTSSLWLLDHLRIASEPDTDITEALKALNIAYNLGTNAFQIPSERVEVLTALQSAYLTEWAQRVDPSAEQSFALADQLASYCKEAWECNGAGLNARIIMAQFGAELWAIIGADGNALALAEAAARMLPALSTWAVGMSDRQYVVANHSRLSSLASSLALRTERGHFQALALLEMGRGIISGQILDIRADLFQLQQQLPDLASQFEALRRELDDSAKVSARLQYEMVSTTRMVETQMQRQRYSERQYNDVLGNIRMKSGFENFLLWPTEGEMTEAAKHGPIVVLSTSSLRTDAFIIEPTGVRAMELTEASDVDIEEMGKEMKRYAIAPTFDIHPLLCKMWDTIAKPVLEALGFNEPVVNGHWPRMWWVLAGHFSHLPLHAAGDHRLRSGNSVIDRVVSSYAPTVKALVHWHQQKPSSRITEGIHKALLVGMPATPDHEPLPSVEEEVRMLKKLWPSLGLELEPLSQMRKEEVVNHLKQCKIFHFAGHGEADLIDPSRSQLLLEDWQHDALTVSDLRDSRLQDNAPFLAYLSACSTGANKVGTLVDEGIHLAGALQLAGFRHVVGTMWEVSDNHCVDVARSFYESLLTNRMTDEAVAFGLHKSIRQLRQSYLEKSFDNSSIVLRLPAAKRTVQSKEEVVDKFLRSAYETRLAVKKSQIGGMQVLTSSRDSRAPLGCRVGPVKGPTIQRVHWIPYVHFGV